MYKTPELLGLRPLTNNNLCPASVTNKVSKYAYLTAIYCPKPLSFWGLRPMDPRQIRDLPVSQIRNTNMLI